MITDRDCRCKDVGGEPKRLEYGVQVYTDAWGPPRSLKFQVIILCLSRSPILQAW